MFMDILGCFVFTVALVALCEYLQGFGGLKLKQLYEEFTKK